VSEGNVGKPLDRVDGRAKVTGKATFAADTPVARVAYAVIVGSTISRGRIASLGRAEAERVPGVLAVLTHDNAPRLPGGEGKGDSNERVLQLLQDDGVRYDGQPVAVVVARTLEAASFAASLVDARYEVEEATVFVEPASGGAFTPKPSGPRPPPDSSRGDVAGALAAAAVKVDATYTTPLQTHNPMELHGTVAVWQGDNLTLYDATQGIFSVQRRASEVFGIPRSSIRVISHFLGGGFGGKGSPWSHVMLAAMAAKVTGVPVKLVITRPQMFAFVGYRPLTIQHVVLGATRAGKLVATRHDVLSMTSRFDDFMEPSAYLTRMLYACPAVETSHRLVRVDVSTPTFMRGPGESTGSFALESAMDELSYALGMDPLALRLANYAETDPDEDKPYSSKSLRACYTQAAERFGWARRPAAPRAMTDGRLRVGWGMASATYPARQPPSHALARLRADGSALVLAGSQDIGTGTYTIMTQIAADNLGMPIDRVRFDLGDTTFPEAPLSAGSTTASGVGSAVKVACVALRAKMAALAAGDRRSPLHGIDPKDIDAEGGELFARAAPSRREPYEAVVARQPGRIVEAKVDEQEKPERKNYATHSFGAHFVEVRVDEAIGRVSVSRVVSAIAAGRVLNAKTARSQLLGGVVWGIGFALLERTVRDVRDARLVTKDLADYLVPVNADVPAIDVLMVPEEDPWVNAIGAKGMGEIGIVGVAAAVANAVFHATGKRVRDLPITLEKLL